MMRINSEYIDLICLILHILKEDGFFKKAKSKRLDIEG